MNRPALTAVTGLVVLIAAVGLAIWTSQRDDQPPAPEPVVATPGKPAAKPAEKSIAPSFDIVRINPQGETVIAGRAMPRAEVVILDGGKEIGRVIADNRGEWVFVPDQPLPAGSRDLTLKATNPDGSIRETESPVVLMVPDRGKDKSASLAVKVNPDGSIDILQGPEAKEGAGTVSIGAIKYDDKGRLSVTGKAPPKARLQLYLDDQPLGRATADDQGRWQATPKVALRAGSHSVRVDELGADGKVTARAEITFSPSGAPPAEGKVMVEAGTSLWRIARRTYGSGIDYMIIYQANKEQIRDPDRIYPGQVFHLPSQH